MSYKMSTIYRYPNAWRSPYSMARNSAYARRTGKLYFLGFALMLGLNAVFAGTTAAGIFSTTECAVFMTLASVLGTIAASKSFFSMRFAKRMDEVHEVWMEMLEAPLQWRELALSRKAYSHAEQDDALRFILAASITGVGALGFVGMSVLTFVASVNMPALAWVWCVALLCVGSGAIVLWGIRHRHMVRMELQHVLGHREVRPPNMRIPLQRHSGGDAV